MKHRKNKLDPFAARLEQWEAEDKTLAEMQAALKQDGLTISTGSLSLYLSAQREARLQERLFDMIATGGRMNADLDKAFARNPAPEIARLNQVVKTLVMSLQVQGTANPELLELATQLYRTVLEFAKLEAKQRDQSLAERRVELLEKKAAQSDATEKVLSDAELTPEQREQRIKEIYGRA